MPGGVCPTGAIHVWRKVHVCLALPESDMKHDHCTCTVEVSPDEADAGTDITLKVQVTHPRKDGLRGSRVSIRNHEDAELAQAELKKSDGEASGEAYESDDIVLAVPRAA